MDRTASDFPQQTGLPSPYPSNFGGDAHSEASSADHASAQPYPPPPKDAAYPATATPASDYGVYPPPARSTSAYPDHVQRAYQPASSPSTGSMAQQNSPSLPQSDGRNHQASINSDPQVPIDPSIAQPSPTYPYGQHSPYAPNPDMAHSYSHPNSNMYAQPRPEWGGYATQHGAAPLTPGHPVYGQSPASAPQQRPNQVRRLLVISRCYAPRRAFYAPNATIARHQDATLDPESAMRANTLLSAYRSTRSSRSPEPNNTSVPDVATRKSSACTSVVGMAAKRPTAL